MHAHSLTNGSSSSGRFRVAWHGIDTCTHTYARACTHIHAYGSPSFGRFRLVRVWPSYPPTS